MAGDWQMLRLDIHDDPAVIAIAAALNLDEDTIVGKLTRLWGWANRQTENGNVPGVTEKWLDRYIGVTGFAQAMVDAGWLVVESDQVTFPNFDRWMSETAKRRGLTARRVAKSRGNKCNAKSVTKVLPQYSTVHNKETIVVSTKTPKPPLGKTASGIPEELDTPKFTAAWNEWLGYKKESRAKMPARTQEKQLKTLAAMGVADAILSIEQSITHGWIGLFPPSKGTHGKQSTPVGPGQRHRTDGDDWDKTGHI
jgi:hypothetical protein